MKRIKHKPFALIKTGSELSRFLPKHLKLDFKEDSIYGIVLDIKNIDMIDVDNHQVLIEYLFGKDKNSVKDQVGICILCGRSKEEHIQCTTNDKVLWCYSNKEKNGKWQYQYTTKKDDVNKINKISDTVEVEGAQ